MACPFSSMYGATKAFLTEFAISLAPVPRVGCNCSPRLAATDAALAAPLCRRHLKSRFV